MNRSASWLTVAGGAARQTAPGRLRLLSGYGGALLFLN